MWLKPYFSRNVKCVECEYVSVFSIQQTRQWSLLLESLYTLISTIFLPHYYDTKIYLIFFQKSYLEAHHTDHISIFQGKTISNLQH